MKDNMRNKSNNELQDNKKIINKIYIMTGLGIFIYLCILFISFKLFDEGFLLNSIIAVSTFIFVIFAFYLLKVEQETGYYECSRCHNRFVPKYIEVILTMHFGMTRYLKCPQCNKRSFSKKVLSK